MYGISFMNSSNWYVIAAIASLSWILENFIRLWFPKFGQSIFFLHFWTSLDNLVSGGPTNNVNYVYE